MTAAPHDRTGERFWKVQPVYDPDGGGADFAYTIGLSHRGFPELHIWARPSLGDDPGLDWKFSIRDCCGILHELADLLVRGDLQVGSTLRREYDGGLAVVEYHVDPPGDRELLEAYGAPEGADVLPVRWSLSRPPTGPARPLSELDVRRMTKRYDELLGRLGHREGLPKGWELPDRPSFEVDQRFGPLTPLVLARAAQMTQADAEVLRNFLCISHDVNNAMSPTWPMVRARALGRPVGRTPGLDNLATALEQLMEAWSRQYRQRRRWSCVVDQFVAEAPHELRVPRSRIESNLHHVLRTAVEACLAGELVYDLADSQLRLMAAGPWESAVSGDGRPGSEWIASEEVLDRIRSLLNDVSVRELALIADVHADALEAAAGCSCEGYGALVSRIAGFAATSAAVCPPAAELVSGAVRPLLVRRWVADAADGTGRVRYALEDWLTCLAALLVHRAHFTADQVRAFAQPVEGVLPQLRSILDEPLS
jgi:hypothetical protein